ncbi:hypothetical protein POTOM_015811 [Populus tomentosa]|uniref:Peptidase S8/S53 domain-containing protein n=1 Tax=Populus tomentosa TaxID=118781 RepID=A0A8X8A0N4_POPTO|nr:hypothetical protein POTOM_015811 [Populus tomentosa]
MLQESSSSVTTMMSHQCLSIYGPDIAGAYGAILSEDDAEFLQQDYVYMPIVIVSTRDGDLKNCIINTTNTTVRVNFGLTLLGTKPARKWYIFPLEDLIEDPHGLSKPDILSPGYHILAAWVPNKGFAPKGEDDYLLTDYALVSDTSMSCPHAAGIAALLKASHHAWSSASIRSALMKTADVTGNAVRRIIEMTTEVAGTPLDFGAGHVNPNKAMDLDLVLDLNYPSFLALLNMTNTATTTFKKVLTNRADNSSVYHAVISAPQGMEAVAQPTTLAFCRKRQQSWV